MKRFLYLFIATILLYGCSGEDTNSNVVTDPIELTTLKVDGELITMRRNGHGLSRAEPSLQLGFTTEYNPGTLKLSTQYMRTGKNRIIEMIYMTDFTEYYSTEDLQTNTTVNNRVQFTATFSGTFRSENGQTLQITEGSINTVYDNPISPTWGAGGGAGEDTPAPSI